MQLGGAQENVTQVRAGTIMMTWVGMAFLSRTVPELEAVSLPFMFPNREVAYKVMDGPIGALIDQKMADKGFISLGFMELGPRQVTNSVRPIKTMADLKGLKIRLQPNETHLATFRALGANPIAMDIREVYSAMEQKVIDGHENPYALIIDSRFYEVQKYVSNTAHFFDFIAVVANRKKFEALPPEFQQAIKTAMEKAVASQRIAATKADATALAELQKKGMQYDAMPPAEREAMRKATAGVVDDIKKRVGPELVDSVLVEVKKAVRLTVSAATAEIAMSERMPGHLSAMRGPLRPYARLLHGARHGRRAGRSSGCISVMVSWSRCRCCCATRPTRRSAGPTNCRGSPSSGRCSSPFRSAFAPASHIGMEILTSRLPAPVQGALARLMAAIAAALMVLVAWQSAVVAFDQWDEKMASIEASAAWFIVAVAIGCAHSALHLVLIVLDGKPQAGDVGRHRVATRMSLLIILAFMGIALLGMPLAFALGIGGVAGLIASDVDFNLLPTRMMNAINAFPLMSIPFFILAGELMMKAGIMERLIDLANAVVGRVRGGLAHVTMLAGPRPVHGLGRGGGRRQRARQHADSVAAQVLRTRLLHGGGGRRGQPRPDHPAVGRDDRLRVHGRADGVGRRHVHGRRHARPDPRHDR